jgi:hypothetical protein
MAARDYYNDTDPDGKDTHARFKQIGLTVGSVRAVYWGESLSLPVIWLVPRWCSRILE